MKSKFLLVCCAFAGCLAPVVFADTLSALGRVMPQSGVIDVAGTPGDTITKLLVTEGDAVRAGQPLAELSSRDAARQAVARAQADLEAVRAIQQQNIGVAHEQVTLAESQTKIAEDRLARVQSAKDSEFVSPDQIEERTLGVQTNKLKLLQAREGLMSAQRDANKAVEAAETALAAAKTQLALAEVRSPIAGRVLKTMASPGGVVTDAPLFMVGDTSRMIVKVEVYEADALKLKVGQRVTISSASLPKKMQGAVTSISHAVYRNSLQRMDPNESSSSHIVEVTVLMDDVTPLDRLVYLQVDVVIEL